MFGIGGFEFVLILLFAFLIFGPDKLPEIARTVGKGIAKFRAAQEDMNEVLQESKAFDPNAEDPFGDPTETIDKLAATAEKHMRSAASEASSAVKSKTHEGIDGPSPAKPAAPKPAAPASASVKNESFTERKARYERERAAKMAAAAEAAESASSEVLDSSNNATDSVEAQRQRQSSNEATEAASSEVADSSKKVEAPTTEEKPAEGGEQ